MRNNNQGEACGAQVAFARLDCRGPPHAGFLALTQGK
jgi:hypothetical protein